MAITNFENNDINLNRFSGRTPSSICRRMTVERELSSSDTPILLSSCLTRGSIKPEHRLAQSSRSMVEMVYMRYPKKCGVGEYPDKPSQATNGTCYACDTTEKVYVSIRGKCEAMCQNRQLPTGGYCALACGEGDYADKPAMKSDGTCVECAAISYSFI